MKKAILALISMFSCAIYAQEPQNEVGQIAIEEGTPAQYTQPLDYLYDEIEKLIDYQLIDNQSNSLQLFYIRFAVDEQGTPMEFQAIDIDKKNKLFQEIKEFLSKSQWIPGKDAEGNYKKKYVVLPIQLD